MNAENALRYLAHDLASARKNATSLTPQQARDVLEMHALLFPALLRCLMLKPMNDAEAAAFRKEFHAELHRLSEPILTGADFES